ncbi:MAG TPA: hypothetical protein VHE37_10095 [Nevskiaceae bacterium]|nr:hypothetical protein [Nevskiaceae bacterium]
MKSKTTLTAEHQARIDAAQKKIEEICVQADIPVMDLGHVLCKVARQVGGEDGIVGLAAAARWGGH